MQTVCLMSSTTDMPGLLCRPRTPSRMSISWSEVSSVCVCVCEREREGGEREGEKERRLRICGGCSRQKSGR